VRGPLGFKHVEYLSQLLSALDGLHRPRICSAARVAEPRAALRDRHPQDYDATVTHLVLTRLLAAPMALDRGGAVAVTVPSQGAHMNLK
jgi:hypothetical protein